MSRTVTELMDTTVLLNLFDICKDYFGSVCDEQLIQNLVSRATSVLEKLPHCFNFSQFYQAQKIIPRWNNKSLHYPVFLLTARWLQNQKRYQEAISLFDIMLKLNLKKKHVQESVTFQKARCTEDSGAFIEALRLYGAIKSQGRQIAIAIGRCYENIAEMHNKDPNAQFEFYDLAIGEYNSALSRSASPVSMRQQLLLCIGRCYEKMGENDLSIQYFKNADILNDNPKVVSTLFFATQRQQQMQQKQEEAKLEFVAP